jgi:hypothetical protein
VRLASYGVLATRPVSSHTAPTPDVGVPTVPDEAGRSWAAGNRLGDRRAGRPPAQPRSTMRSGEPNPA